MKYITKHKGHCKYPKDLYGCISGNVGSASVQIVSNLMMGGP